MGQKVITITGVIFAVVFVAVFLLIWGQSRDIISTEIDSINSLYRSELPFDISLFDDRLVSGASAINLQEDMDATGYTHSMNIEIRPNVSSLEAYATYRSTLEYGANGVVEAIVLTKVD